MRKKVVTGMLVTLLILSMLTFVLSVRQVRASGTIYIKADGSVDPESAPIQRDGDIYFLTDNIYDEIVVERSSIVVDGRGYTVEGGGAGTGIYLRSYADNVTIRNLQIQNFNGGIGVASSSNIIHRNNITYCSVGIFMAEVADTKITENTIADNDYGIDTNTVDHLNVSMNNVINNDVGIQLYYASDSIISGNSITNNYEIGIELVYSSNNYIYHNNFIDNPLYIWASNNVWDAGYPSGGNYWSDYTGSDLFRGANQNETGSDGIGDTPYFVGETEKDNYPLMRPWTLVPSTKYPWPMFRHDLRHTGYTESPAPNTNQTQWKYETEYSISSSPTVADGKVYIGSAEIPSKVYCLDAYTGVQIWNYTVSGHAVYSIPAVADGNVYVGANDGNVYCLNALTGTRIWNYTTNGMVISSPAVVDGNVYVGSDDGNVYCLNASTGARIWNCSTGGWIRSSPAVVYGKVYVGSWNGKVYCLDAMTGAIIWNYTTGDSVESSPAVADNKVYIGSYDRKVYCLNALTGAYIWSYTTGNVLRSSPAVAYGKVYIGSWEWTGKVYCFNASTGVPLWSYTAGDVVRSSPAVADGKVYVGSYNNKTHCFDASTGAFIWSYTTNGPVMSSPAVADGMVFVGSWDYALYAFGNIIRVPEDYPTVQEAIDAAEPGATIIVAPGTYYNQSMVIDKTLTIIGLPGSEPIFDGGGSGIAITLLPSASGSTITGIVITNWDQGIFFVDSANCEIYGNIMSLMDESGIVLQGNNAANNRIYNNIFQGNNIAINLTESSTNNIIYSNNFFNNAIQVYISMPEVCVNIWDNGYPSGGNYWSDFEDRYPSVEDIYSGPYQNIAGSDGIWDQPYEIAEDNVDRYPLVKPFSGIGITKVTTSKTIIGQGYTLRIDLKIINYGIDDEISTVTVDANTITIATLTNTILTSRNLTIITFTWNTTGVAKGNYTITAKATPLPYETDITDNTYIDGWIIVAMVGDFTGSGYPPPSSPNDKIDINDIRYFIDAYKSQYGITPPYPIDPTLCDLTGPGYPPPSSPNGVININDIRYFIDLYKAQYE